MSRPVLFSIELAFGAWRNGSNIRTRGSLRNTPSQTKMPMIAGARKLSWISNVRGDGTAEISRQQHGAKNGRRRKDIKDSA